MIEYNKRVFNPKKILVAKLASISAFSLFFLGKGVVSDTKLFVLTCLSMFGVYIVFRAYYKLYSRCGLCCSKLSWEHYSDLKSEKSAILRSPFPGIKLKKLARSRLFNLCRYRVEYVICKGCNKRAVIDYGH